MAETLTESFCERCGTRYEFSAPTRLNPLRKTRGVFGGLKNYLTSQDALSDAIGDAMRSEEGALASAQLEAFHESFNFCIDCRQYTCVNCWNDDAGRCRSCAPIAGTDDLVERVAASLAGEPTIVIADGPPPALGLEAWPTSDLPEEPYATPYTNGQVEEPWPGPDHLEPVEGYVAADGFVYDSPDKAEAISAQLQAEPEPLVAEVEPEPMVAEVEPEPEPMVAEVEPEPEPMVAEVEPEPIAADAELELPRLRIVAWDDDAAFELEPEPVAAAALPEPVVAEVEPEPEPMVAEVEPEPEPMVAEVEPEPEPMVAEVEPEPIAPRRVGPISDTILRFPQRPADPQSTPEQVAAEAEHPEIAARRAQLDLLGLGDPGEGPVQPDRPAVLPYRSRGAGIGQGELAARAAAHGATFWEASAREVASAVGNVGVQSCGQCGLSLSANARFCRRCGTSQARSA